MGSRKKHRKHKKEKNDAEKPALKLILKVGNSSTPEHSDSPGPLIQASSYTITPEDESLHLLPSLHKKSKKKKRKREKDHDKHERKKKHHHKEKKKHSLDDSSQDNISVIEDSSTDVPVHLKDSSILKNSGDSPSFDTSVREARLCVQLLKQKNNRTPFQRLLDYAQQELEKKDTKQVFAWPVTDEIAPGYSQTISQPMDFSTMRQKIDDNCYCDLNSYIADLRLMCNNAMTYNHPETMYYKAAKRLLHAGLKMLSSEKLRQLALTFPVIYHVPPEELGFELGLEHIPEFEDQNNLEFPSEKERNDSAKDVTSPKRKHCNTNLENKFEAIADDLSPEEILEIAQKAAKMSAEKLALKRAKSNMGFLKQKTDGSTALTIFVMGEKIDHSDMTERPISLGQIICKPSHGAGQLQGTQDRKNIPRSVKTMNCNYNTSYAPSYDSTFANLTREETELIYETYGDENATIYAESVLNFGKDCDYTSTMVDNLLDLLTGGEHRKAKFIIDEHKKYREEEERVKELMETKSNSCSSLNTPKCDLTNLKIEFDQLKSLSEYGIDTSFLRSFEPNKASSCPHEKIENSALLEKLQHPQNESLPTAPPPPPILNQILQPPHPELHLTKIPESLVDLEKEVPSGSIMPVPSLRKPMNMVPESSLVSTSTNTPMPISNPVETAVVTLDDDSSGEEESCVAVGVDFESELREFLESDTALSGFPLHDDKTIEEMLSES